jgi:L-asparaginase
MKILFIQTGGTIDKDYPKSTKGYAFEISEPAVKRILEKVNPSFEFEIIPLLQKDSLDITDENRQKIFDTCLSTKDDKIIITHGTDTLIETAKFLSGIKDKTIILTGAIKPERFKDSDAEFNIGAAIGAISVIQAGLYIAMNGRIFEYDKVSRDETTGKFVDT